MAASHWDRFSSRLKAVDEAREPFRSALRRELRAEESSVLLLIYTPPNGSSKAKLPASVLALTDNGWLLAVETEGGDATTSRSDFAGTLLVELTVILLYGSMRIDFVSDGRTQSVTLQFNTVMERLYQQAAQLLLDGIDHVSAIVPVDRQSEPRLLDVLPLKFYNAALEFMPQGEHLLGLAHWPAVFAGKRRWFQRELAPEAMLALTDRELMLISEEKTWSWLRIGRASKYGNVITHCPLARLEGYHLSEEGPLARIDLVVGKEAVGESVPMVLPSERKGLVSELILRAFQQKAGPHLATG